jgi:hypothetical protein
MPSTGKNAVSARNIIGARVRQARLANSPPITQDQLSGRLAAEGVQLDRVALAKIEAGTRCAFDFEVKAIGRALKVDVRWLLDCGPISSRLSVRRQKK